MAFVRELTVLCLSVFMIGTGLDTVDCAGPDHLDAQQLRFHGDMNAHTRSHHDGAMSQTRVNDRASLDQLPPEASSLVAWRDADGNPPPRHDVQLPPQPLGLLATDVARSPSTVGVNLPDTEMTSLFPTSLNNEAR